MRVESKSLLERADVKPHGTPFWRIGVPGAVVSIFPGVGPYHKPHACRSKAGNVPACHPHRGGLGTCNMVGASKPSEQFLHSLLVSELEQAAGGERKAGLQSRGRRKQIGCFFVILAGFLSYRRGGPLKPSAEVTVSL